jgi:hypothetical protein
MRYVPVLILLGASSGFSQTLPEFLLPPVDATVSATSDLPSTPKGRSTVLGGRLEKVDLVQDQLKLKVFGGRSINVLFDERTQVYRDGKKMSVLDLHPDAHASIETTLDGTSIFALRIHLLSEQPEGHIDGQVMSYNGQTGELKVRLTGTNDVLTLTVPAGATFARVGQKAFASQPTGSSDLVRGSIIEVTFRSKGDGPGLASQIDVLAVPGSTFVFHGNLSSIDLQAGRMTIASNAESRPMDVSFDPNQFAVAHDLHNGATVVVTTRFDGMRYVVSGMTVE